MLSRICSRFYLSQAQCCSRASVNLFSKCQTRVPSVRLFSLNSVKSKRFVPTPKKPLNGHDVANLAESLRIGDSIPVRPASDLWKALGFTIAGTSLFYCVAAYSEYRKLGKRAQVFFEAIWEETGNVIFGHKRSSSNSKRFFDIGEMSPSQWNTIKIGAACVLVTLAWRLPTAKGFMWRYFTNSFASKSLCLPMLLSVFSHKALLHLVANMYVLHSFASPSIDSFLGVDQFNAMYLAGGLFSSFTSLVHKCATRSPGRALGASGAICAVLVYTCLRMPDARLSVLGLPSFTFSAENAVRGFIAFDASCLVLGIITKWGPFFIFDHAAHLGGSLFGLFYAFYGEEWYRKHFRPFLFKQFKSMKI